jgi:tol-pal system protein YbgF
MRFLFVLITLISVTTTLHPAFAQNNDMRAVMSRLEQLQRQMDTISRQVYRGEPPAEALSPKAAASDNNAGLAAAMDERLSSLEGSIRQINNRLDEQDYAIGQSKQQFDLFKSDLEVRLKEFGSAPQITQSEPPLVPNETPVATAPKNESKPEETSSINIDAGTMKDLPTDNAAALYDAAFQALREQKYDRAESGFSEFVKRYPKDDLAGNAQYWLGETFYVRGNYTESAKIFAQAYQKYPKSTKAPDNLLKLGLSLSQNSKKQDACVTLMQLGKQFPNAAAVIVQRANDEMKKLNCGAAL